MSTPASAFFGLATSAMWGVGDFLGGYSSRRAHVAHVAWLGSFVAMAAMAAFAWLVREPWPTAQALGWAGAAGLAGGAGLVTFYRALASGRMGVVAPVTAVAFAAIPAIAAVIDSGFPPAAQAAGFVLALGGIALVAGRVGSGRVPWRSLALAVAAGACFALFAMALAESGKGGFLWCLAAAKAGSLAAPALWVAVARPPLAGLAGTAKTAAAAGLLDVTANASLLAGSLAGSLAVTVVLGSFYPAVTVLLARVVLGERLHLGQAAGALLLVAAVPLLAFL